MYLILKRFKIMVYYMVSDDKKIKIPDEKPMKNPSDRIKTG